MHLHGWGHAVATRQISSHPCHSCWMRTAFPNQAFYEQLEVAANGHHQAATAAGEPRVFGHSGARPPEGAPAVEHR